MAEAKFKCPWRNPSGTWSLKKIGATIGILSFYGMCWYSVTKDPTMFDAVIDKVGWFTGALLSLKIASGVSSKISSNTTTEATE